MNMSGASTIAAVGLFSSGLAAGQSVIRPDPAGVMQVLTSNSFTVLPGLTTSFPLVINKIFQDPRGQSANQRLVIWNKGYEAARASIPFTAFGAAAFYLIGAYRYPLTGSVRKAAIVSSLVHVSLIPFTVSFRSEPRYCKLSAS